MELVNKPVGPEGAEKDRILAVDYNITQDSRDWAEWAVVLPSMLFVIAQAIMIVLSWLFTAISP